MSMEGGGSVTLIFYKINHHWWKEPILNIVAAAAQNSSFTHVELAIGNESSHDGAMQNVVRVFNDNVGVEVCSRTGRNPGEPHRHTPGTHHTWNICDACVRSSCVQLIHTCNWAAPRRPRTRC